jgi:hypothetical protein
MALNGWGKNVELTISNSMVSGSSVANFAVAINHEVVPSDLFNAGDGCKEDGSDIRFALDSSGNNLLDHEILFVDKTNSIFMTYVKMDLSGSSNNTLYMFWNNPNASAIETSVWDEYYGVVHFSEETGQGDGWKTARDSRGTYNSISEVGTPGYVDGPLPGTKAWSTVSGSGNYGDCSELIKLEDDFYFEMWLNHNGTPPSAGSQNIFAPKTFFAGVGTTGIGLNTGGALVLRDTNIGGSTSNWSIWHHFAFFRSGSTLKYYIDGVLEVTTNYTGVPEELRWMPGDGSVFVQFPSTRFSIHGLKFTRKSLVSNPDDSIITRWRNFDNITSYISFGTVQTVTVSSSLLITGLEDGTEVRVYDLNDSFNELGGIESSTGGEFELSYSGTYNVNVVILQPGFEYEIFTNLTLPNGGITIPLQPEADIWYDSIYSSNLNTSNVIINEGAGTIQVNVVFQMKELYAYLMDRWKSTNSLFDAIFPLDPITDEQFILRSPWDWDSDVTRDNIRGAGYQRLNSDGSIAEKWMLIKTLGSLTVGEYAHFTRDVNGTSTWDDDFLIVDSTGSIERVVKIFGDVNNGDVNNSTHFVIFYRNLGETYVQYDLVSEQGISELTYRKYAIPLSSGLDTSASETDPTNLNASPYTSINIEYNTSPVSRTVDGQAYDFNIIIDGAGLTLSQIYDRVRFLQNRSRFQNMYDSGSGESSSGRTEENIHLSYLGQILYTEPGVFIENFAGSDLNNVVFKDVNGVEVSYPLSVSFELTGLVPNSEVRIYRDSDMTEIAGIENSTTTFSYVYEYSSDIDVYVVVHNVDYEYININTTLGSSPTSIPIQQQFDRVG